MKGDIVISQKKSTDYRVRFWLVNNSQQSLESEQTQQY
jgi:hypothetical protein